MHIYICSYIQTNKTVGYGMDSNMNLPLKNGKNIPKVKLQVDRNQYAYVRLLNSTTI